MPGLDSVICVGPPEEAALYFEHVLPLDQSLALLNLAISDEHHTHPIYQAGEASIPLSGGDFDARVIKSLLPHLENSEEIYSKYVLLEFPFLCAVLVNTLGTKTSWDPDKTINQLEPLRANFASFGIELDSFIRSLKAGGVDSAQISKAMIPRILELVKEAGFKGSPGWRSYIGMKQAPLGSVQDSNRRIEYAVTLSNLNLIDPTKLSWDSIVEFRKDKRSFSSLKRFRAFFVENFEGKEQQYVSDKLHTLLDEYEQTSKLWAFETARKSLAVAVSNQNVIGSSIGSIASVLAGGGASVAAALGATITVGSCGLEFTRICLDERKSAFSQPLTYLTQLKRLVTASTI